MTLFHCAEVNISFVHFIGYVSLLETYKDTVAHIEPFNSGPAWKEEANLSINSAGTELWPWDR